jgi:nitrous oxidase accessory protein
MKFKSILFILVLVSTINCTFANTITVGTNNNNGNDTFSSIQEAINFAEDTDSIIINDGIYSETLFINKSVNIFSERLGLKKQRMIRNIIR